MTRPRAFDIDVATDRALELFRVRGYEGASLSELASVMGINRPSLYAAFDSKEGLFRRALERYTARRGLGIAEAMSAATAKEAAFQVMRSYADWSSQAEGARGCLLVQGALVCSEDGAEIQKLLAKERDGVQATLRKRFERAAAEGDLPDDARPAELAQYVWTVCNGLSVQATGGATRAQLRRVVDLAIRAWPK